MVNFLTQAYLSYKAMFLWLTWWSYISNVVFVPSLYLILFAVAGRAANIKGPIDYYMIGMIAYSIPSILVGGIIQSFTYERGFGTLHVLFASYGRRLLIYLGKGLFHCPNAILAAGSSFLCAWLLLRLDISNFNWVTAVCSIVLMTASCAAFALLAGIFTIVFREVYGVMLMAAPGILMLLTGGIIPRERLPEPFGFLSQFLPLSNGLAALRKSFNGVGVALVIDDLARELIIGVTYIILGFLIFRILEWHAKQTGAYELANI